LPEKQLTKILGRTALGRIRRDWTAYLQLLLRRRPKNVRVLIFGQGRTGSTLLEDLLCSTGHFAKHGEILGKGAWRVRFPAAFLKGTARRRPRDNFICHVKPTHLRRDRELAGATPVDMKVFLQSIMDDGFKIIHLTRPNKLRQFLSQKMAEARGRYHKWDDQPETLKLIIDPQTLEQELEWRIERDRTEIAALEGLDLITVEYARDLENPVAHQATIDRILDSLSLERRPVQTSLRKVNQRPLRETVENYDEFAARLSVLGRADWLDDDQVESEPVFRTENFL
jgi:LPS sulfotransferase NodH